MDSLAGSIYAQRRRRSPIAVLLDDTADIAVFDEPMAPA
jgi:hypothetical protein